MLESVVLILRQTGNEKENQGCLYTEIIGDEEQDVGVAG